MTVDNSPKKIGYVAQLGTLLGVTGVGLIISLILSLVIWLMMEGGSIPSKTEEILLPKYYNVNMVIQVISTLFIFFLPAWFFARICYRQPAKFLGFNLHINYRQVFLVVAILILTFPLSGALGELNKILPIPQSWALKFQKMELNREAEEAVFIQINTFPKYLISLIIIALLPALFEETFFRGGLQNLFVRWFKGPWAAILLTSVIFSLIHLSFYGFLVRFALGVILGFLFYYSGSLWLSVLLHFLFNGVQVTILFIMNLSGEKKVKDIETQFPLWMGIFALVILVYLFAVYKRISAEEKIKYRAIEIIDNDTPDWTHNQS